MKTDQETYFFNIADFQRQRLVRWLKEWELDRILRSASEDEKATASTVSIRSTFFPSEMTGQPQVGQIRLLYPAFSSSADRPIYVAVLKETREQSFLVAPFGRFAEPALPGEWQTGLKAISLRVLCLWNMREVSGTTLAMSWKAGTMEPAKLRQALELIRSGSGPKTVSERRIGQPVLHPLDPRWIYQAEEAESLDENLAGLERKYEESASHDRGCGLVYNASAGELRIAAESRAKYGSRPGRKPEKRKQEGPPCGD